MNYTFIVAIKELDPEDFPQVMIALGDVGTVTGVHAVAPDEFDPDEIQLDLSEEKDAE